MDIASKKLLSIKNDEIEKVYKKVDVKTQDDILLLTEAKDTDGLYRELGLKSKADYVNKTLKKAREIASYDKRFDQNHPSFRGEHLKKLCNKYDLQLLPLSSLNGFLNEEAVKAIDIFSKTYDKGISESSFFALAPRSYFKEKFNGKECDNLIIFFRDPSDRFSSSGYAKIEEDTLITQVYSKGKDFSNIRRIRKFVSDDLYHKDSVSKRTSLLIITALASVIGLIAFSVGGGTITFTTILAFYMIFIIGNSIEFMSHEYWNTEFDKNNS